MSSDPCQHFDVLLRLLRLERQAEEQEVREIRSDSSLRARVERGWAIDDLEAVDERWGVGARLYVTFERALKGRVGSRFESGAMVDVCPRKAAEQDALCRGVVHRRRGSELVIAFDRPPPRAYLSARLRAELAANDATYQRARRAVREVAAMDRGAQRRRRDVLLGQARPRFAQRDEVSARSAGDGPPFNLEQTEAVERALAAQDFFLVHGPPGTGKSTVLAQVACNSVRRGERVLATAASNAAVDHLLSLCLRAGLVVVRVGHPARVSDNLVDFTLDAVVARQEEWKLAQTLLDEAYGLQGYARKQRRQGRSRERFDQARQANRDARSLLDEARALQRRCVRAVLERAQVVGVTCASLDGGVLAGSSFDLALLDEATQAIEPIALLPFCRSPRVIMAGDHKQLPPTIKSPEALRAGLSVSLFERLLAVHGDESRIMLCEQHRMHRTIMALPSDAMYDGALRAHGSVSAHRLEDILSPGSGLDVPPLLFLDTAGKGFDEERQRDGQSYFNPGEATLVVQRVRSLLRAGLDAENIAVIAPYSAQISHLHERASSEGIPAAVEMDTVDAFQGREKEAVLVSLTRSNGEGDIGFLRDLRRMNVAMTRARRHLFVVGDSGTLSQHPFYERFVSYAQGCAGYRSAWAWPEGEG